MKAFHLFILTTFLSFKLSAQLIDSFENGNFKENPAWFGDTSFFMINGSSQLQSNGPSETANIYLYTHNQQLDNTEWQFWTHFPFNPSTSNYARVYLMSDDPDLKDALNGYYIRLGGISGSLDAIDLFRQDGNRSTMIINGKPGHAGKESNTLRIKVIRDFYGNWSLYSDTTGGHDFVHEGSAFDDTFTKTDWFGINCYHTTTRRDRFFFDDFKIQDAPFMAQKISAIEKNSLSLSFNYPLSIETSGDEIILLNNTLAPGSLSIDPENPSTLRIEFPEKFREGTNSLSISGFKDINGNIQAYPMQITFSYIPSYTYGDVLITELLPKPAPSVGLPEEEFIELYNNTADTINLNGFTFSDPSAIAILPDYKLAPQQYVILCRSSAVPEFSEFGPAIGLSRWPILNIGGDELWIRDAHGNPVFNLNYSSSWYQEENKDVGGWTLEMIDKTKHCYEKENWKASEDPSGGTPGKVNSVNGILEPGLPFVEKAEVISSSALNLTFNANLDSTGIISSAFNIRHHTFEIRKSLIQSDVIGIKFSPALQEGIPYTLDISKLYSCDGREIDNLELSFVIPSKNDSLDVIINEVLFNPKTGGREFVEIYNNSPKYIDLKDWELANFRNDAIATRRKISSENLILAPRQYLVLTTDKEIVTEHYPNSVTENILEMSSLPSYPNSSGTVILLDNQGKVSDRFDYSERYHFALLGDKKGISLERISFFAPTNDGNNWHSASATAGYASPGYQNSQASGAESDRAIYVEPKVFNPNGDGFRDFTLIYYKMPDSGYLANVTIFDTKGREIRKLAQNHILGRDGFFQWDGTNEQLSKVNIGYYIVYLEIFDLKGNVNSFKETVVVGTKLN
ncbi:MAG: lamin tail domain-containing protein [Cytophagaceae bacterium]